MPCYDGRDREVDREAEAAERSEKLKYQKEVGLLQGGLCAIITELEKKGIANEVLSQASKSGLVDLMHFWNAHSKKDETRIAYELHKFSEHEQDILKKLLNNKGKQKETK